MGTVRSARPSAAPPNAIQSTKTTLADMNGFGTWRPMADPRPPGLPFKQGLAKPALQSIWNNPSTQPPNGSPIGSPPPLAGSWLTAPGLPSLGRDPKPHQSTDSFELPDQSQWTKFEPDADKMRLAVGTPSRAPPTQNPKPTDFPSMGNRQYQAPSGFGAHRQGLMGSAPKFTSFEPRIRDISGGAWDDAAPVQSMAENPRDYLQPSSAGASRNGSLPPSRSGNEPFSFNGLPKYLSRPGSGVSSSSNVPTLASRRSSDEAVSPGRLMDNGPDPRVRGQPSPRYEFGQHYDNPQSFDEVVPTESIRDMTLRSWNARQPSPTDDRSSPYMARDYDPSQYSVARQQDYGMWNRTPDRRPSHVHPSAYVSHGQFQAFQNLMNNLQYQPQFQYMPPQAYFQPMIPMQMPMPLPQMPMQAPISRPYEPGVPVQSQLLREFKTGTKRDRRWELKDIYGHVVEFAGDTTGSRFLQGKLETANSDEKGYIFAEIFPNCLPLMRDVFGNYVIQKVFEHGDQKQKAMLADQMKTRVYELSINMYACRVVQKAFDYILDDQRAMLVSELSKPGLVLGCVESLHGNHVIQKAIEVIPLQHIRFIYDELLDRVPRFADHLYGCRIVQRMLEQPDVEIRDKVLAELYRVGPALITSTYGNYVAQHVMEHGGDAGREWIINVVVKDIRAYGRHKFASNVVEKCIEFGSPTHRKAILNAVLDCDAAVKVPGGDSEDGMLGFIKCAFGNYVIRKSVVLCERN
jgi:mRNA-binding protein PUF3